MHVEDAFLLAEESAAKGDIVEAEKNYLLALDDAPEQVLVLRKLGQLLATNCRWEDAFVYIKQAYAYEPNHAGTLMMMGACSGALGLYGPARQYFNRALEIAPCMPGAKWNLGLLQLAEGQYMEGWENYRWGTVHNRTRRIRTLWPEIETADDPHTESTLLLWAEQGFGDTLQFVRFVKLLRSLRPDLRIILEVQHSLVSLLQKQDTGADDVVGWLEDGSLPFGTTYHASLMSLPRILSAYEEAHFWPGQPYLRSPWKSLETSNRLRVGICWKGSGGHADDRRRSIKGGDFASVCLQLFSKRAQLVSLVPGGEHVGTLADINVVDLSTWEYTSQVISGLDYVITVDTAVAHLAGAMGKPVSVILPLAADFRWGIDRQDCPWYPNTLLHRCTAERDMLAALTEACHNALVRLENVKNSDGPEPEPPSDVYLEGGETASRPHTQLTFDLRGIEGGSPNE